MRNIEENERHARGEGEMLRKPVKPPLDPSSDEPRWDYKCDVCGQSPVHPLTGMCGPCTFGEADTIGGNW